MTSRTIKWMAASVAGLFSVAYAVDRPNYYTSGFYTRGVDEAAYVDQGGVIDPFYVPVRQWTLVPRVTLEASGEDNYYMDDDGGEDLTSLNLIPGLLLIAGRPEFNHLYADLGASVPLVQSGVDAEDKPSFFGTFGGVYKTGKSLVSASAGYRRNENANLLTGERMLERNVTGTLGLEHRLSFKTSVGVNGTVEFHNYDSDSYSNYRRYYGAGRIYRRLTAKSEVFLQAGAGRDVMDRNENNSSGGARFTDLSVGLRGKPSPKTSVSGSVGYRNRVHDNSEFDDVNSWIASIGADATPFGLSRFSVDLVSDIRPDVTGASGSAGDNRVTFGWGRRLFSERLRGSASVQFGTVDYYGEDRRYDADYWGYSLGLDWWTRHNLSFGGAYSYTQREGYGQSSYDSGRWSLRMSWNY